MCGIIGYYGPLNPKDVIVEGLKKLEYRGYDSAGIAVLDHGKFKRVRAEGKLRELEKKLVGETFDGHLGIGHTRWATHGPPVERNAHPHYVDGVSIIHNGIIENYSELKTELQKLGAVFDSDTDSELVAHLLARQVKIDKDLFQSVLKVLPRLRGAYSIVTVWEGSPDQLVAFKNGPPLVMGKTKDSVMVASDVQAIISHTQDIIFFEDDEIFVSHGAEFKVYDRQGKTIEKKFSHLKWTPEQNEKKGFAHYMLKEINEQPRAVAAAIQPHIDVQNHTVRMMGLGFSVKKSDELEGMDLNLDRKTTEEQFSKVERMVIVACGTSFYAALYAKYLIENLAKIPVDVDIASEFRYRETISTPNTMALMISQSGETADTLAALRKLKELGTPVMCICNVRHSSIDRESNAHIYMNVGSEIGVASTKAFAGTLSLLNVLALDLAKCRKQLTPVDEKKYVQSLLALPSQLETVLNYDKFFAEAAVTLKRFRGFLYMGRGVNYPLALEGALKMKELAYMHAEGYAAGEMKHGPLALIDKEMAVVMIAPSDELFEKTLSNLEEARARGGQIIAVGTGDNEKLKKLSLHYLSLPEATWNINPLLVMIPLQLLAYHVASALGHDVDQPRNLAKSVTVE
jgi:glucosamine--fructose-6-phosphate aminotransferase (isomerizing)